MKPRLDSEQYGLLSSQDSPKNPDGQKQISWSGSLGSAPHTPLFSQGGVHVLSKLHVNKVAEFIKDLYVLIRSAIIFNLCIERYLPSSQKSP